MHAVEVSGVTPVTGEDQWFVTNGLEAVGPVSFGLMQRGLDAGRIPVDSFVRHSSWKVWRKLRDIEGLSKEQREKKVAELAEVSAAVEARASDPRNEAPPPPPAEELEGPANDATPPSLQPPSIDPETVFASAEDLEQAFLLALSTSVTAASAHIGLIHVVRPDLKTTACSFAQGHGVEALLGERMAENDPALLAAQAGHTVMGEMRLGEAGKHIAGRVARALPGPRGVAMVPVRMNGALLALIELGRSTRPFRAREIAPVEAVADALVARIEETRWL